MWGSGLAGVLCAVAALATGASEPWRIGFVASFVSKLSDTVSSEIGKVRLLSQSCVFISHGVPCTIHVTHESPPCSAA